MLRKGVILTVLIAALVLMTASLAGAQELYYDYFKQVTLVIGEKQAEINGKPALMDQNAYIRNGRTLVPFRFLGEALGADILWNDKSKQASLKLNGTEVIVTLGSKVAYINGKLTTLDVPAEVTGGRTFIPLRFVSESLGADVDYESTTKTITVTYINTAGWKEFKLPGSQEVLYRYPADWKLTLEENGTEIHITSPRETETWVEWYTGKDVNEFVNFHKERPIEGFKYDSEDYIDPANPNDGVWLTFIETDPVDSDNPLYFYMFFGLDGDDSIMVIDEFIYPNDYFCDDPILMKIIFG